MPPQVGEVWLFNTSSIAREEAKDCKYSAWQPTFADFHKP